MFWGRNSPFSQWYRCRFIIDHVSYNCAEQFMMRQKALLFGDLEKAVKIMHTTSPFMQKRLGRQVANFSEKIWLEKCKDIVKRGNTAKFNQNPTLKGALLKTKGTTLVESSPCDILWGNGLTADNPKAQNKANWLGKNWLGYILTEIRDNELYYLYYH